ncbi:MAG TPA: hypothetical protein VKG45_00970 [Actinomycetes bacterium]|nr:hypothetical protein [Actinomycetes bacterium]
MRNDAHVRSAAPGAFTAPGSPAPAGAAMVQALAAVVLLGVLLLAAALLLLLIPTGRAAAAAAGPGAGRFAGPPAAGPAAALSARDRFLAWRLEGLETLRATAGPPASEAVPANRPAGDPGARPGGAGPDGRLPEGGPSLPLVPLAWALPPVRVERGLPREHPGADDLPAGDPATGDRVGPPPAVSGAPLALAQGIPDAWAAGAGWPAVESAASVGALHGRSRSLAQPVVYAGLHQYGRKMFGFTRRDPLEEFWGLFLADAVTQYFISDPPVGVLPSLAEAVLGTALVTGAVYGMTRANELHFNNPGLRRLLHNIRPQVPDQELPFLAPRSPKATALTAGLLMLAGGPLTRLEQSTGQLPYPDTPLHYWENLLHDMIVHGLVAGGVAGAVDFTERRREHRILHATDSGRVVFSTPYRGIRRLELRPSAGELARTWGRNPSAGLAAMRWSVARYGLTAGLWAAFSKGVSELVAHPPPGRVGDRILHASAVVDGVRVVRSGAGFWELLGGVVVNQLEAAWSVGLEAVGWNGWLVTGVPLALARLGATGWMGWAAWRGDRATVEWLGNSWVFDVVGRETQAAATAALARADRAWRSALAAEPDEVVGRVVRLGMSVVDLADAKVEVALARWGAAPAGGGSREERVAAAQARVAADRARIARDAAQVQVAVAEGLAAAEAVVASPEQGHRREPVRSTPDAQLVLAPSGDLEALAAEVSGWTAAAPAGRLVSLRGPVPGLERRAPTLATDGGGGDGDGARDGEDAGQVPGRTADNRLEVTILWIRTDSFVSEGGWFVITKDTVVSGLPLQRGTVIDPNDNVYPPGSTNPVGTFAELVARRAAPGAGPAVPAHADDGANVPREADDGTRLPREAVVEPGAEPRDAGATPAVQAPAPGERHSGLDATPPDDRLAALPAAAEPPRQQLTGAAAQPARPTGAAEQTPVGPVPVLLPSVAADPSDVPDSDSTVTSSPVPSGTDDPGGDLGSIPFADTG